MSLRRLYTCLLRLYPADYRASFETEMLDSFERMEQEHRARGKASHARFVAAEFVNLVFGSLAEWIAKASTDRSIRGRCLPDLRKMRPAGVPRELWFAAASGTGSPPDELAEAQLRVSVLVDRMVQAIATHDFEGARRFSRLEETERENLRRLQARRRIAG